MTQTASVVTRETQNGVALLTLNRPDRMNSWNPDLQDALFAHLDACAQDPDVRSIVVTGAGRAFCAGADMEVISSATEDSEGSSHPLLLPTKIPKPIIAAINGPCAGIGLQLAVMCDVRFAGEGVKFTTAFSRRGLIAEHGLSWLMPKLCGLANSLDLLLSGRVFLADEALHLGLVHRVVPREDVVDAALAYAEDLATNVSPTSMAVIKEQLYRHVDTSLELAIDESDVLMDESLGRPDVDEGVASFVEKRSPSFPPYVAK